MLQCKTKQAWRADLLKKRAALTDVQQEQAARQLVDDMQALPLFVESKRIGFYYPHKGEVDARLAAHAALVQGKHLFLPVIDSATRHLYFAPYTLDAPLVNNAWGIPEPVVSSDKLCDVSALDMIWVPLVGYDAYNNRLGMGGGYYDRTLAAAQKASAHKPYCVGLAYTIQAAGPGELLPVDAWDIKMDAIIALSV